jgi:hypothetical protein
MPRHDQSKCFFQVGIGNHAFQAPAHDNVKRWIARVELMQQPQAPLARGAGKLKLFLPRHDEWPSLHRWIVYAIGRYGVDVVKVLSDIDFSIHELWRQTPVSKALAEATLEEFVFPCRHD